MSKHNIYIIFHNLGHLKFWKKKGVGIEFAKHFRSHLGPIEGLAVSIASDFQCELFFFDLRYCHLKFRHMLLHV